MSEEPYWSIEKCVVNYKAKLIRIVASLFKMARIVPGEVHDPNDPEIWNISLPRYAWRRVMDIVQPAESALRRLIIMAADGKSFVPQPQAVCSGKADGDDIAAQTVSAESPDPESLCVRQDSLTCLAHTGSETPVGLSDNPALEAKPSSRRPPVFDMFDPLKKFGFCGFYEDDEWEALQAHKAANPVFIPQADPLKRMDPINALSLWKRIQALHHALENFDACVTRYVRWRGLSRYQMKNKLPLTGRKRLGLMRGGYAPGYVHKGKSESKHEVQDVLGDVHVLAWNLLSPSKYRWDGG